MWYFIGFQTIFSLISNIKEINGGTIKLLKFDPDLNVTEGAPMELKCTASQEIKSCAFEIPGLPKINQANDTKNAQFKFLGRLEDGVCSIRVFKAKKEYQGDATCLVTYPNNKQGQTATTNVEVSTGIPPRSMQMTANNRYYEFQEGREMKFVCTALHGTSPPNISIYLDNDIQNSSSDLHSLTWSALVNFSHHHKKISCKMAHEKLENTMSSSRSLTVFFQPRSKTEVKNGTVEVYAAEDEDAAMTVLRVELLANPKPDSINWTIIREGGLGIVYHDLDVARVDSDQNDVTWLTRLDITNETSRVSSKIKFLLSACNAYGFLNLTVKCANQIIYDFPIHTTIQYEQNFPDKPQILITMCTLIGLLIGLIAIFVIAKCCRENSPIKSTALVSRIETKELSQPEISDQVENLKRSALQAGSKRRIGSVAFGNNSAEQLWKKSMHSET